MCAIRWHKQPTTSLNDDERQILAIYYGKTPLFSIEIHMMLVTLGAKERNKKRRVREK